jgi:hypothetical protein
VPPASLKHRCTGPSYQHTTHPPTTTTTHPAAWGDDKVAKEDLEEWANDWDDDALETDFDKHLAAELVKTGHVLQAQPGGK